MTFLKDVRELHKKCEDCDFIPQRWEDVRRDFTQCLASTLEVISLKLHSVEVVENQGVFYVIAEVRKSEDTG